MAYMIRGWSTGGLLADLATAVTFALLGAAVVLWWQHYQTLIEPVRVFTASIEPKQAKPGDEVWLVLDRDRKRTCPGVGYELWYTPDGSKIQGEVIPIGGGDVGRDIGKIRKRVPKNAPPGRLCYDPLLEFRCDGQLHILRQPVACVDVLPTDQSP